MGSADTVSAALIRDSSTRQRLVRLSALRRRPTFWMALGIGTAWIVLLTMLSNEAQAGSDTSARGIWWCTADMMGMQGSRTGGSLIASVAATLPMCALMSIAMMLPASIPAVQHVAVNSLHWRRRRATTEFLLTYLGIWTSFGAIASVALARWHAAHTRVALASVLLLAVAWQLTPIKRRALQACHRSTPLPPRGWRATVGVARFGLRNGGACFASCWAIMFVMAVAESGRILWMFGVTCLISAEKLARKPRQATKYSAAALSATAVGAVAAVALG